MKVRIVDKREPRFKLLGTMEAVVGMVSTVGNPIRSVGPTSCRIEFEGRLVRKTDVSIDITTAREYGWTENGENGSAPARSALARNASASGTPQRSVNATNGLKKPKRDADFWEHKAGEKLRVAERDLRPYEAARINKANLAEYDYRVQRGLEHQQWAAVLSALAEKVRSGQLPPVLYGLTNDIQVRTLMQWNEKDNWRQEPRNMGPTIKTPEQLKEAASEVQILMPQLEHDPNPNPRAGTKYEKGALTNDRL